MSSVVMPILAVDFLGLNDEVWAVVLVTCTLEDVILPSVVVGRKYLSTSTTKLKPIAPCEVKISANK
jgi:hypothetical protein